MFVTTIGGLIYVWPTIKRTKLIPDDQRIIRLDSKASIFTVVGGAPKSIPIEDRYTSAHSMILLTLAQLMTELQSNILVNLEGLHEHWQGHRSVPWRGRYDRHAACGDGKGAASGSAMM